MAWAFKISMDAAWLTAVAVTLMLRHTLTKTIALRERINGINKENFLESVSANQRIHFSGRALKTNAVITEADLLGLPSTVFLMSVADAYSRPPRQEFMSLVSLAWRRSLGRLWILCQSTREICAEAVAPMEHWRGFEPIVLCEPQGDIGSVCPTNDGVNTIIHLDSAGNIVSYGYARPRVSTTPLLN